MEFGISELRGPINGDKEIEPALGRTQFGDVDVNIANLSLELAFRRRVAFNSGQTADAVAGQTAM